MEYFLFWLAFSAVVGAAASSRGRSFVGWMLISTVISPLLGLILVLVIPSRARNTSATPGKSDGAHDSASHRRCPACAESVRKEAIKCKHCGHAIITDDVRASLMDPANADGFVEIDVAGESNYQDALRPIAEAHASLQTDQLLTATLVAESNNPHDASAVRVDVASRAVGYLPRAIAQRYRAAVRAHFKLKGPVPPITVPAETRGKDRNYGVFLHLPPDLADRML